MATSRTATHYIIAGSVFVLLLWAVALFAPLLCPYDPCEIELNARLMGPSKTHLLGTDALGRDVFSRMLVGARVSLYVGCIAVGIALVIGLVLGALAGYYGGWVDWCIMRAVDIMLCFPSFFLILAVIAILEPSLLNVMIVIGCTSWMSVARLIRAEILSLKTRDFIDASRLAGASDGWIITRHLVPNAIGPVLVSAVLGMASAVLIEGALSFLGLGVQPPVPSWGNILAEGRMSLGTAWWLMVFPGVGIFVAVMAYNVLGEGLRMRMEHE